MDHPKPKAYAAPFPCNPHCEGLVRLASPAGRRWSHPLAAPEPHKTGADSGGRRRPGGAWASPGRRRSTCTVLEGRSSRVCPGWMDAPARGAPRWPPPAFHKRPSRQGLASPAEAAKMPAGGDMDRECSCATVDRATGRGRGTESTAGIETASKNLRIGPKLLPLPLLPPPSPYPPLPSPSPPSHRRCRMWLNRTLNRMVCWGTDNRTTIHSGVCTANRPQTDGDSVRRRYCPLSWGVCACAKTWSA